MSLRLSSVHRSISRARQQARARNRRRRLWALEGLEGRVLLSGNPTYYTVNLTSDTGASSGTDSYPTAGTPSGDLLWAITQANANTNPAGSVIDFDPTVFATSQTITLSSTLVLSESAGPEVIDASTVAGAVTISGNNAVGVFQVSSGATATLSDLTIADGSAVNGGGGIDVFSGATLTALNNTISSSGNGGIVVGSGATATITGNSITGNSILVDEGGTATVTGNFISGGQYTDIEVAGSATIGGTSTGAGNSLSGPTAEYGIQVDSSGTATILGNSVGGELGFEGDDILVFGAATIGGTSAGAANSISGNRSGRGITVEGTAAIIGNSIANNGFGDGIEVDGSATIGGTSAGAGNSISGGGIVVDPSGTATILGNSISGYGYGILVSGAATIGGTSAGAGNSISVLTAVPFGGDPGTGISVSGGTATIVGNSVSGNSDQGIVVSDGGAATITDDSITGNGTGILVGSGAGDTSLVTAQDDDLSGNTTAGLTNNQTNPAYAVTATDDWWGSEHGPTTAANPGGNGTTVSSNVNFSPWIGVYSSSATLGFYPIGITLYAVPTRLVFVTEPSATIVQGVAFGAQPVVEAEDGSGDLGINFDAASVSGVQAVMTLNVISGSGTLQGATAVSPSGGFASFSGLNIAGIGTYTLTA